MKVQEKKVMDIKPPVLTEAKFVDFKTEKEEWAEYRLADKSKLKAKFVLTGILIDKTVEEIRKEVKALKPGQPLKVGLGFKAQRIFSAEPPMNLRGAPDRKRTRKELRSSIVEKDIDFETVKLSWNTYLLDNGMIFKCRLLPTVVNRTSKFDDLGIPIYLIDSTLDAKVTLPKDIEEILASKEKALRKKRT